MSGRDVLGITLAYGPGCLCAGYTVVRWRICTEVRIVLASTLVFGLAYLVSGRWLVPSGLAACSLAPLTGVLLRHSCVELAVLTGLALVMLVAHRDNPRAALRPVSAAS